MINDDDGSDGDKMDFKMIFPNNGRRPKQREQTPQRISRRKRKHRKPGLISSEPAPTFQYDDASRPSASQQKTRIKSLIFADLDIPIDKLQRTLESEGIMVSTMTLHNIKRAFKEDLKFLAAMGRFTPHPK